MAGLGAEGDGIDSNGWLVINGGTVVASANPGADAGMDSDMGSFVNGGTVVALGSTMDWAESDSEQVTMNLQFAQYEASDSAIVVTDEGGTIVFAYDPSEDEVLGANARKYMGAILSCPDFALENRYHVYIGGTLTGTETAGIYDAASVTDYTGGVQQAYTGSDIRMRPGGMGGFGNPSDPAGHLPFTGEAQDRPEPPEGGFPPQSPQGGDSSPASGGAMGDRPELPEGFEPGERPEPMDGAGEPQELFFMQDKVNNFSGVGDK